ncbi:MAG: TenA family protein [Candidatus Eiseniibacteriota bacterium]|jgi:thiaminase/transcriptional activator TenA
MASVLHESLWNDCRDLARACREHAFVRGLADGSLPAGIFARYVAQDAFYLRAFFRAYALAAARAERIEHLELFHELLGGSIEEMRMHERNAARLGIDLATTAPLAATRRYTEFLLDLAWKQGLPDIIAGMTPCMRLYAYLGRELARDPAPDLPRSYGEWIGAYAGDSFQLLADRHDVLLDELASDTPELRARYRRAMELELAFFDAAWHGEG